MTVCRLVKCGGNDLRIHASLHVCDFFWPLVDEQDDQVDLWVVEADGVGHVLQQGGFSCFGLRHNHATLSLADGGKKVHQSRAYGASRCAEFEALLWEQRRQEFEWHTVADPFRAAPIDAFDPNQRVVFLANAGRPDVRHHGVAGLEAKLLQLFS